MINQISNINLNNSQSINNQQINNAQKLPDINSLALIQVLDKIGSNYKILINGNLFQSKLPANLKPGEETIAKVISHNPFSLKLNELLKAQNQTPERISLLLSLLGIDQDEESLNFVKELVANKQFLKKSKINRVLDFLDRKQCGDDILLLNLLVKIYSAEDEYLDYLLENENTIFAKSFTEIVEEIFTVIKKLNKESGNNSITYIINNYLVRNISLKAENESQKAFSEEQFLELVSYLDYEVKNGLLAHSLSKTLSDLKNNLVYLIIQSSIYNYFGLYPSFLVIQKDDEMNLINFNLLKETTSKNNNIFRYGLIVPTKSLGDVILKGYMSRDLLYSKVHLKNNKNQKLEKELTKISEEFHFKYDLNAYIGLGEEVENEKHTIWNNETIAKTY